VGKGCGAARSGRRILGFVEIGASGGEEFASIKDLLGALPQPVPVVVMVVLHRPGDGIGSLRTIPGRSCRMPMVLAEDTGKLLAGTSYIGEPTGT
jgi:chemotaxis response regulator CheB